MTLRFFLRAAGLASIAALAMLALHTGDAMAATAGGGLSGFVKDNMAPIMFAALVVFLLLGYPVPSRWRPTACSSPIIGIDLAFSCRTSSALPERYLTAR